MQAAGGSISMPCKISVETLALLHELVPGSSPIGAYAMGMLCGAAFRHGLQPGRSALESVRTAQSIANAETLIDLWLQDLKNNA